jgi:hypothetical protein
MRSLIYILFCILILFNLTCSESTNESRRGSSGIQGMVVDENENPIANVGIHIVFNDFPLPGNIINKMSDLDSMYLPVFYQLYQNYPNPFNPTTMIQYALAKRSEVDLNIYDRKGILIGNLVNHQVQEPGMHAVKWNGKNKDGQFCTDGLYRYVFQTDTFRIEKEMCVHQRVPEVLEGCVPLTMTDENGSFMVDEDYLPVGEKVIHTSESGDSLGVLTISGNVSVVLTKEGCGSVVDTVQFVPGQLINKNYSMTLK